MKSLLVFSDDSAEIVRDRREVLILRVLLTALIAMFVVGVSCVLLGLAILIWNISTQPQGSTTPPQTITTYLITTSTLSPTTIQSTTPLPIVVTSTESSFETTTSTLATTTLTSEYKNVLEFTDKTDKYWQARKRKYVQKIFGALRYLWTVGPK